MITETALVQNIRRGDHIVIVPGARGIRVESIRQHTNRLWYLELENGSTINLRPSTELDRVVIP